MGWHVCVINCCQSVQAFLLENICTDITGYKHIEDVHVTFRRQKEKRIFDKITAVLTSIFHILVFSKG